jgi:hypothetical protein
MKRLWLASVVLASLLVPSALFAGSSTGFSGVVSSIESRYHVRATHIPLLGFAGFISRKVAHSGVSDLHVAEFDSFKEPVDGEELNRMVAEKLGADWELVVRETSRKDNEQTLVFIHPDDKRMGLFVVDLSDHEMDIVEASVDPNRLNEELAHYEHHLREDRHSQGESD